MRDVVATDDPNVAFKVMWHLVAQRLCKRPMYRNCSSKPQISSCCLQDVDAAFLVGAMPRKEGMER